MQDTIGMTTVSGATVKIRKSGRKNVKKKSSLNYVSMVIKMIRNLNEREIVIIKSNRRRDVF